MFPLPLPPTLSPISSLPQLIHSCSVSPQKRQAALGYHPAMAYQILVRLGSSSSFEAGQGSPVSERKGSENQTIESETAPASTIKSHRRTFPQTNSITTYSSTLPPTVFMGSSQCSSPLQYTLSRLSKPPWLCSGHFLTISSVPLSSLLSPHTQTFLPAHHCVGSSPERVISLSETPNRRGCSMGDFRFTQFLSSLWNFSTWN